MRQYETKTYKNQTDIVQIQKMIIAIKNQSNSNFSLTLLNFITTSVIPKNLKQVATLINSGFAFTRIYRDSPHFSLNFSIVYSLKIIAVIEYIISIDKIYLPLSILSEKM